MHKIELHYNPSSNCSIERFRSTISEKIRRRNKPRKAVRVFEKIKVTDQIESEIIGVTS